MQTAQPQAEHLWLKKLVGTWTYESEASMGPDQPQIKSTGTETVRSLKDLWFIGEGDMIMPDGNPGTTIITLGYNPDQKRYVGTWIGSMMTHMWVYDGRMEGDKLHLEAEGASMEGDGTMATYRDTIEFLSDDHRTLTASVLGKDGKWTEFMKMEYRRQK